MRAIFCVRNGNLKKRENVEPFFEGFTFLIASLSMWPFMIRKISTLYQKTKAWIYFFTQ